MNVSHLKPGSLTALVEEFQMSACMHGTLCCDEQDDVLVFAIARGGTKQSLFLRGGTALPLLVLPKGSEQWDDCHPLTISKLLMPLILPHSKVMVQNNDWVILQFLKRQSQ